MVAGLDLDRPDRLRGPESGFHVIASDFRGTQRIVSVNYLFGRPLIPYNFLKGIFTSNFRDMVNLMPSLFGLIKMSFRVPKRGQ